MRLDDAPAIASMTCTRETFAPAPVPPIPAPVSDGAICTSDGKGFEGFIHLVPKKEGLIHGKMSGLMLAGSGRGEVVLTDCRAPARPPEVNLLVSPNMEGETWWK